MTTHTRTSSRRLLPSLADPRETERIMRRLDRLEATTEPAWGRMDALGMLRHLNDAFAAMDGSPPGTLADEAAELTTYVARYAAGNVPTGRAHPFIGPLSAWEWQRWAYLHVDHHFRQFRV